MRRVMLVVAAVAACGVLWPATADAARRDDGGGHGGGGGGGDGGRAELRVDAVCDRGARARLRLRARDGVIRANFELSERRSGRRWKVVLIHERRVEARVRATTRGDRHSLEVERNVSDLGGADEVRVRASGPGGLTCTANATLPG